MSSADEAELAQALSDTLLGIADTVFADSGHAIRCVHAKSHGLLKAELEVLPDLPSVPAQGMFARPGRYPVVMRFSTTSGDLLDDSVSTPRGLAIKILGIEGDRLDGASTATIRDFITANGPSFNARRGVPVATQRNCRTRARHAGRHA